MSGDDVSAELGYAKEAIRLGHYNDAIQAIKRAEKAWQIEVDAWAIELAAAEKEIRELDIPGFASGGVVGPSAAIWVGECGPEIGRRP